MSFLLPMSHYLPEHDEALEALEACEPSYTYAGTCPDSGAQLSLPRTALSEAVARRLMEELEAEPISPREGKMFGVLVVEDARGALGVLKAFAGQIEGRPFLEGWVPPLPGHEHVALDEAQTLERLQAIKAAMIALGEQPAFAAYAEQKRECDAAYQALLAAHKEAKAHRRQQREALAAREEGEALEAALAMLNGQSHQESLARRDLRRAHERQLAPLAEEVAELRRQIQELRAERKALSRQLQAQMHAVYWLKNFAGEARSLRQLADALPSGTGDCCAPKLLHFAACHGLRPLGLAEFWWGLPPANDSKQQAAFYGACVERCQPIMGFLLSGLPSSAQALTHHPMALDILYEDEDLLVVHKPSGLLSVPGRTSDAYDSVASRARHLFPDATGPLAVHRLDMSTSGLLLLARHRDSHRLLSAQFKQRKVQKEYLAVLCGVLSRDEGELELPLSEDPQASPRQRVDWEGGKPSRTRYQVLSRNAEAQTTRVRLFPLTGRTHQLRVHCASAEGLAAPILGDSLYQHRDCPRCDGASRLHLHAASLSFHHPADGREMRFECPAPF